MVHQFMLRTSADRNTAEIDPVRGDERERLLKLDREAREGFAGIIIAYRLFVWQKTIQSIYGEPFLNQINAIDADAEVNKLTKSLSSQVSALYEIATDTSRQIAFDTAIIAQMMHEYLDRTLPERVLDEIVQACQAVLRNEMFYFPPYVRYLIRTLVHGNDKSVEAMIEDPLI
jgi:hypothetical protein